MLILLLCSTVNAATTLFTEGFEGSFPPDGWTENSIDQSTTYVFNGTYSAKFSATGDYLITPPISNATTFIFWSFTTSADPQIIVEQSVSLSGPWTEFPESPFSGDTEQWNGRWVTLTNSQPVYIRLRKNGTGSLYIDDVAAEDDSTPSANRPPLLTPIENKSVRLTNSLSFTVTATDADNDMIMLSADNIPPGAVFNSSSGMGNATGTFSWVSAAAVGIYMPTFYVHDGTTNTSLTVVITVREPPPLLISEIADPAGTGGGNFRFIELYNAGSTPVLLEGGPWFLSKQVNGGSWSDTPLAGTIQAGGTFVIAYDETSFQEAYGFLPNQSSINISGTGNDACFLYSGGDHTAGTLIDVYGEFDTDGTATAWDYTDGRAERNKDVLEPNAVWTAGEWTITPGATTDNMTPGEHGPRPVFQGLENQFVFLSTDLNLIVTATNPVRPDVITISALELPEGATFPVVTGTNSVSGVLNWPAPTAGVYSVTLAAEGAAGTRIRQISVTVSATDAIDGNFGGWLPGTIVKLKNGQFWRNTGGAGSPVSPVLRSPDVTVTNVFGARRMIVEAVPAYTTVERIEIAESAVESGFTGLHNGNMYELADGTVWKQTSYDNIASTVDPVTVWRWTENGRIFIRFVDRNNTAVGTCEVTASQPPAGGPVVTEIDGWFRGWENRRVFALANGQFWQQIAADSSVDTLYRPSVTLTNYLGTGMWRLYVDGASAPGYVEVQQLTNVVRTAIDGMFYGFRNGAFFRLQNGEWWRQNSIETSSLIRSNPEVLLWNNTIEMPDEGRAVSAEELAVISESSITGTFNGLRYATVYGLANGQEWLQVSFENSAPADEPAAMLWIEDDSTRLLVRDSFDRIIGTCTVVDPWSDPDGDGLSNADETVAGTSLRDRNDFFMIGEIQHNAEGRAVLRWAPVSGRAYTIEWTPSLLQSFQPLETLTDWTRDRWTDSVNPPGSGGFYRIRVELTP